MFLTNHSSAFLLHDVRVVKNVACLSSLVSIAVAFCKLRTSNATSQMQIYVSRKIIEHIHLPCLFSVRKLTYKFFEYDIFILLVNRTGKTFND